MKKEIYLAGGCFWGVEEYYSRLNGVISTEVGYANGNRVNPTYLEVRSGVTNAAETVKVTYEDKEISLSTLLEHYLRFVDPYSLNKQGEDVGTQYRVGVYYLDENEKEIIKNYFDSRLNKGYYIEIKRLESFYPAEEYHQDYLKKNPDGYCHVNLNLIKNSEMKR